MRSESRRSQLDHERYMRNREERLQKQRDYYRNNTELCKASVKRCKKKRVERELKFWKPLIRLQRLSIQSSEAD